VDLVGIWEPDAELRSRYLGGLSAPVAPSVQALLDSGEVDIALVGGIYESRAACAAAALTAGAHVLSDKPLATRTEQLALLESAVADGGGHLSIAFEKRRDPVTLAARSLLEGGVLGRIAMISSTGPHKLTQSSRPSWFLDPAVYGGIAGDLPIHDIDLVLQLTGAENGTVSALTGNARPGDHPGFDDHVAVLLNAGGVPASIEAGWLGPEAADVHGHYRMWITGSEGSAELDWAYHSLSVTTHDRTTWTEPLPDGDTWPGEYFFDAISKGEAPEITTAESLLATRIALLAQRSAEAGGETMAW
jgi:predicted dehydrogenase